MHRTRTETLAAAYLEQRHSMPTWIAKLHEIFKTVAVQQQYLTQAESGPDKKCRSTKFITKFRINRSIFYME